VWLAGISLVLLVTLLPFSSYIVSLPFIQAEWHMNNTQAAMVFSSYLLGNAVAALFLVPLTDKLPPQRVYLGGVIVLTVSNLLFPLLAWNLWTGSALRFVAGAGHIAAYIPGVQLVARRFAGGRRGTAVGVFVAAGYAGTTLSYTFMGLLLNWTSGWRSAYLITACLGLLALVLLAFLRLLTHEKADSPPLPRAATQKRGLINIGVLKNRAVALVIVAYTLHTAELYIARLWFPSLLSESFVKHGMSAFEATTLAATLAGFMFMMGIVGVFSGGFISDHLGRSYGAAVIFTLSGLCSFLVGWLLETPSFLLITVGFIYGFMTAADSAIYSTAVTELAPANRVGSTQAVQSFIGFAVGAILPVVAGSILDLAQAAAGWRLAFSFNGVLAILGVAALLWLKQLPESREMAAGKG
jgi:MFS family permease